MSLLDPTASITLRKLQPVGVSDGAATITFGQQGGLIGRGAHCDWVLVDPERIISKEHARIIFREDAFYVVGLGRNGIFMNSGPRALDAGVPVLLRSGDRIRFGHLDIAVDAIIKETPVPSPALPAASDHLISTEWEARLGELLRAAGPVPLADPVTGATSPPLPDERAAAGASPMTSAVRVSDLPPPTVVLAPEALAEPSSAGGANPVPGHSVWGQEGPLAALLLGHEAELPQPSAHAGAGSPVSSPAMVPPPASARVDSAFTEEPYHQEAAWSWPKGPSSAGLPGFVVDDSQASVLPPDAAFLRGIGIGLPQMTGQQAAVVAYDLGRAFAALTDFLVEILHQQPRSGAGPFSALPTGPLALSELVASPDYRPAQIERQVREAIGQVRSYVRTAGDKPAQADLSAFDPFELMRRWNLDPLRRASAARAWALYEANFENLAEQVRTSQDPAKPETGTAALLRATPK